MLERTWIVGCLMMFLLAGVAQARPGRDAGTQDHPNLSGDWALNRQLSDDPQHDDASARTQPNGGRRGGFGGRGGFGRGGFGGRYGGGAGSRRADVDPATIQQAIDEARSPSPSLTISHSAANIAITDARGRTRFFQTSGATDKHQLDAGTVDSTTSWNGGDLVIQYDLGNGRRMTYTYSLLAATKQLVVRIRIDGSGSGRGPATLKYVYEPAHPR